MGRKRGSTTSRQVFMVFNINLEGTYFTIIFGAYNVAIYVNFTRGKCWKAFNGISRNSKYWVCDGAQLTFSYEEKKININVVNASHQKLYFVKI